MKPEIRRPVLRAIGRSPRFLASPLRVALVAVLGAFTCACSEESQLVDNEQPDIPPVVVVDTAQGIDLADVKLLVNRIRKGTQYEGVHSLLVQRHGVLVVEEYFETSSAEELHTLQSVTKSVTSALIGIAIEQGHIESLDERVVDFFPEWREDLVQDARRAVMRVEDILTMKTGTDFHESGPSSPLAQLNSLSSGWDRFWLERPMVHDPGTFWRYDSGGVVTLSSMLKQRTGMHADLYADEVLFGPMGITESRWSRNAEAHPHTGGGLFLRARDMMKFGQLFLQRGRWGESQLVTESWVDSSIQRREVFTTPRGSAGKTEAYGYLWWLLAPDPDGSGTRDIYAAMGYRGQYIFVVPEHDMVVVVTGWIEPQQQGGPITFLYEDILPAVIR